MVGLECIRIALYSLHINPFNSWVLVKISLLFIPSTALTEIELKAKLEWKREEEMMVASSCSAERNSLLCC